MIDHPVGVGRPEGEGPRTPVPQDLVDAFFDRELDEGSRERFFKMLRADLDTCAQVARTQRMLSQLRENIDAPDLTDRIMGELSARDRFLPSRLRRMVKAGRLAVAACLLLGVLGVAVAHRYSPDTFGLTPRERPVSDLVSSGKSEAAAGVQVLAEAIKLGARVQENPRALVVPGISAGQRAGQPPHGMISLRLSASSAPVTIPKMGSGAIVVYTGAGPDNRFIVPESLYMDGAAVAMPLGYISPTRLGREWMHVETDGMFVLPPVEAAPAEAPAADAAGVVKVRVLRPAEPTPEKP